MNTKAKINILSVDIDALTIEQANDAIAKFANQPSGSVSKIIVKPYVEFLVTATKDKEIANILNQADLCLADGVSLQWAASFLYGSPKKKPFKVSRSGLKWLQSQPWRSQIIPEKMAGATQTTALLKLAEANNWRVGIIGGQNTPSQIKEAVSKRFPRLSFLETWSGFYNSEDENIIITTIAESKLDVLFVAMGFPRQEKFMFRNKDKHLAKVLIGEGGTFDYEQMGGPIKRAPLWMQKSGTEWLWRLAKQPKRLKRQLSIPKFVWAVKKQSKNI